MSTPTFYKPINRARALLTSPHVIGDGILVVDTGAIFGTPSTSHPVKVTATVSGVDVHFSITSRSSNTLNIASVLEGSSDIDIPTGTGVEVRITAKDLQDIHDVLTDGVMSGIGGPLAGGTEGRVLFTDAGPIVNDDANFVWDSTNHRLGLGVVSPASPLHVHALNTNTVTQTIQGYPGQSADMLRFVDSDGNVKSKINNAGWLSIGNNTTIYCPIELQVQGVDLGVGAYYGSIRITNPAGTGGMLMGYAADRAFGVFSGSGLNSGFAFVVNSGGTNYEAFRLDPSRNVGVNVAGAGPVGQFQIINDYAGQAVITLDMASGQTADAMQVRTSGNVVKTRIYASGAIQLSHLADSDAPNDSWYYSTNTSQATYKDSSGIIRSLSSIPYAISTLAANYTLPSYGTFQTIGLSINLPIAGTYLMQSNFRTAMQAHGGGYAQTQIQLYDTTNSAAIADSTRSTAWDGAGSGVTQQTHTAFSWIVTVAGAVTIEIQMMGGGTATWDFAIAASDDQGKTSLNYLRIA